MAEVMLLEIRGVGGATAEEILNGPAVQTAGDELAGFYRPETPTSQPTEAYEWGRLTSGSRTSALWWVLFPFTLINIAGWMFRPSASELDRRDELRRSSLWFSRLVIVAGGLAITATYVMWIVSLTTEMVAFGCRADTTCTDRWYMAPLTLFGAQNDMWLITCGVGLAAIVILGLFLFILRTQDKLEGYETDTARRLIGVLGERNTSRLRRNTKLEDPAFWYKWAEHRRLFRWHLGLTMVLLGAATGHAVKTVGWHAPQTDAWPAMIAILVAVLAMLWALTGPERFREAARVGQRTGTDTGDRVGWMLTHVGSAVAGGIAGWLLTAWLRGDGSGFAYLSAVRGLSFLLYTGALIMVILLATRKRQRHVATSWPTTLMPGFAAALAVIITGAGFTAVANLLGRFLLGAEWVGAHGFNIVLVDIFMLSLLITGLIVAVAIWRADKPTETVTHDYFGADANYNSLPDRERSWVGQVARARVIAATPGDADRLLAALTVVMLTLNLGQLVASGFNVAPGPDGGFASPLFGIDGLSFFHTWAATATVLYLFPGVQLIRATTKSRDSRRQLGKVWDVLSFWPRRFHPLAAPCYAERAVPEFRNRIRQHLADGKGVVVSAHSQGTVIAFAALAQIAAENEPLDIAMTEVMPNRVEAETAAGSESAADGKITFNHLDAMVQESGQRRAPETVGAPAPSAVSLTRAGLVTFGSPLSSLYGAYFPWHFGTPGRFQSLRNALADLDDVGHAWRSLWRPTDYIGQKVFVSPGGELDPADPAADIEVREAAQPLFPYESHSNYERAPQVQDQISSLLAGLSTL